MSQQSACREIFKEEDEKSFSFERPIVTFRLFVGKDTANLCDHLDITNEFNSSAVLVLCRRKSIERERVLLSISVWNLKWEEKRGFKVIRCKRKWRTRPFFSKRTIPGPIRTIELFVFWLDARLLFFWPCLDDRYIDFFLLFFHFIH